MNMYMYMYIYYIPDYEQEGLDGCVLVKDKTKGYWKVHVNDVSVILFLFNLQRERLESQ